MKTRTPTAAEAEVLADLARLAALDPERFWNEFEVYPARGNAWTARRRTLRRLAAAGLVEGQAVYGLVQNYRPVCKA